jgi:thymidylate synthase
MKTLGEAWILGICDILEGSESQQVEDYTEKLNCQFTFWYNGIDEILQSEERLAQDISEMKKVFFSEEENVFGHSYKNAVIGPFGNNGLVDIVKLLKESTNSKRAVLTYTPYGTGKVPCINVIHFMIRNNRLVINYFSRGQDIYRKFPCDAVCISEMGRIVAEELGIEMGNVTANISSAHIYDYDIEKAKAISKIHRLEVQKDVAVNW